MLARRSTAVSCSVVVVVVGGCRCLTLRPAHHGFSRQLGHRRPGLQLGGRGRILPGGSAFARVRSNAPSLSQQEHMRIFCACDVTSVPVQTGQARIRSLLWCAGSIAGSASVALCGEGRGRGCVGRAGFL